MHNIYVLPKTTLLTILLRCLNGLCYNYRLKFFQKYKLANNTSLMNLKELPQKSKCLHTNYTIKCIWCMNTILKYQYKNSNSPLT